MIKIISEFRCKYNGFFQNLGNWETVDLDSGPHDF